MNGFALVNNNRFVLPIVLQATTSPFSPRPPHLIFINLATIITSTGS